jgi:hypothetical protein
LSYAFLFVLLFGASASAFAGIYSFSPTPPDLWDLPHSNYFSWGISWSIPSDEDISEATLFIENLNNWTWESGDTLFIRLLDDPAPGVTTFSDTDSTNGHPPAYDNWTGQGVLIAAYHDYNENVPVDKTYKFSSLGLIPTLKSYASNGVFGFGFDPDCHYYNCGITFTVETRENPPVPEPAGLTALAAGLISLTGLITRRRKR